MEKLLIIDSLNLRIASEHGVSHILDNINLSIVRGKIISLVGQSGSGKSMLAKSILALTEHLKNIQIEGKIIFEANEGSIDILKADVKQLNKFRNEDIGIVFQQSKESFNPVFTVGKQIQEKLSIDKNLKDVDPHQKVLNILSEVGLNPPGRFFSSYPHQLSGGQIQRCLIALALINDPILLIADEPSSALDQSLKIGIIKLLKKLNTERGLTVFLISHDLKLVAEVSDDIAIIQDGKIIEIGNAKEIISNPQTDQTKSLLACQPPEGRKLHKLATLNDFVDDNNLSSAQFYEQQTLGFEELQLRRNLIAESQILLKAKNLTKRYARTNHILKKNTEFINVFTGLSFSIKKGEIFGLLGESGSGKSTLARIIAGFEFPDSGWVKVNGKNINKLSVSDKAAYQKSVQYIYQDPLSALAPHFNVREIIAEALSLNKLPVSIESIIFYLSKVGLDQSFINKLPREMSGGERQRVLIARALVFKPELLICDEILSALDVSYQAQIVNLLMDLNKNNNLTILIITHDEIMLRYMSDNILYLDS